MNIEQDFKPRLIELPKSKGKGGALSFIEEGENLPFQVRRIYWIYGIDFEVERANHCHEFSHRVMFCLHGKVIVNIDDLYKEHYSFELTAPNQALYIPPKHWIKLTLSPETILLSASSHLYEDDFAITNYDDFLALGQF